jgi:hypothetical protein
VVVVVVVVVVGCLSRERSAETDVCVLCAIGWHTNSTTPDRTPNRLFSHSLSLSLPPSSLLSRLLSPPGARSYPSDSPTESSVILLFLSPPQANVRACTHKRALSLTLSLSLSPHSDSPRACACPSEIPPLLCFRTSLLSSPFIAPAIPIPLHTSPPPPPAARSLAAAGRGGVGVRAGFSRRSFSVCHTERFCYHCEFFYGQCGSRISLAPTASGRASTCAAAPRSLTSEEYVRYIILDSQLALRTRGHVCWFAERCVRVAQGSLLLSQRRALEYRHLALRV